MDSIRRGFKFFKQSWQMAFKDPDLIKPTIYAMLVGFIVSIIGIIPIVLASLVLGDTSFGNYATFGLGAILVFVQYTVSYIFSAMTIYLIYGYLSEGDGRMDKAWQIARRDIFDIITLAGASTAVKILEGFVRGKKQRGVRNIAANLINTIWTEATYLVLPAMVIEDINLKGGLQRATDIVKNNLLLVGVSTVGVGFITGIIGFLLGATGIALGFGVGFGLISVMGSNTLGLVTGISLGSAIALSLILLGVMIGKYTTTAYHTCLYLWARDVEKAQGSGLEVDNIMAPEPLASILS